MTVAERTASADTGPEPGGPVSAFPGSGVPGPGGPGAPGGSRTDPGAAGRADGGRVGPSAGEQRQSGGRAVSPDLDAVDDGVIRRLGARAPSVPRLFADRVSASGDTEAFRYRRGPGWTSVTWREADQRVRRLAAGLLDAGVRRGDRVALACSTRYEWIVADLAIMAAGGACTGVFPTTSLEDTAFILADCGATVAIVENASILAKLEASRDQLPALRRVVVIDPPATGADGDASAVIDGGQSWTTTLDALEDAGAGLLTRDPGAVDRAVAELGPDDLATLVYTSGTTGRPKGARLVHDCWTYQAAAIGERHLLGPDDVQLLWLPMAHSFANVLLAAQLATGMVTAVDGRVDRLVENMVAQRPTFVAAAPRIFEKARARITETATSSPVRGRLFESAFAVGARVQRLQESGRRVPAVLRARYAVADRLVFAKIRARFGGRLRFFVSGAAPLNPELGRWFGVAGIPILEGYGLTETSGAMFVNMPWRNEFGRVGGPFPGCEVRIADDGEVLLRGPSVMRGYHGDPAGAGVTGLGDDGWLATGDIGNLRDGYLAITDRKKDLIKTSNGKYVAPQKVENLLTAESPYLASAMVVGDGRNYCAALLAPDPEALGGWAERNGLGELPYAELVDTEQVRKLFSGAVDAVNARLSQWETVKRFALMPDPPTEDNGLLTATQKLRRRAVATRYAELVDSLYA